MEPPSIERPEPRKTGYQMLDIVSSVCALFISFISIYMAYDNGRDMQKLVHANSWPALQLGSGNMSDEGVRQIGFFLNNAGVGPARIHSFEFVIDGQSISDGYMLARIAEVCCAEDLRRAREKHPGEMREALGSNNSRPIASTFLPPGQETIAMRWPLTDNNADIWNAVDRARQEGRLTTRACYCSVFDECWVAEAGTFPPRQVSQCPDLRKPPPAQPVSPARASR